MNLAMRAPPSVSRRLVTKTPPTPGVFGKSAKSIENKRVEFSCVQKSAQDVKGKDLGRVTGGAE